MPMSREKSPSRRSSMVGRGSSWIRDRRAVVAGGPPGRDGAGVAPMSRGRAARAVYQRLRTGPPATDPRALRSRLHYGGPPTLATAVVPPPLALEPVGDMSPREPGPWSGRADPAGA